MIVFVVEALMLLWFLLDSTFAGFNFCWIQFLLDSSFAGFMFCWIQVCCVHHCTDMKARGLFRNMMSSQRSFGYICVEELESQ